MFLSCAAHSLYTEWRESTPHTQTLLPNTRLARPACFTMATFSGFCLRAFAASRLESAVKQVGGSGGDRDGGGGGRGLGVRRCRGVCPCLCAGGVARRGSGRAAGRNRTATAAAGTGAVAVTQGWWQPPRAGCSRRGEVTGGRDRCALLECARQSSSDAAMVTCVRGDGKGRAAARAHRGLSLDGEWGERESSQARVPVMRDDIDSWSRPRLAERLKVVGLRAHVAGDARPQQPRRGDDDGEEHHGGEERHGPVWARSSFRSRHGHGTGFSFIRASEVNRRRITVGAGEGSQGLEVFSVATIAGSTH